MEDGKQGTSLIDRLTGAALIAGGIVLIIFTWRLGVGTWRMPGPGAWPFLLSISLFFLGGCLFFRPDPSAKAIVTSKPRWRPFIFALFTMLGYVLFLIPLGYLVSTALLLFFQFRYVERRRWGNSILAALLGAVISFIVFGVYLKVSLPAGIIPLRTG